MKKFQKKNRINSRKDREIKLLGAQLVKFKKYLKSGNLEKIQNEPEIEILGDEDSETGQNDGETILTEKTGFDENNDINNVRVNKSKKTNAGTGDEIVPNEGNNEDEENNDLEEKSHNDDGDNIFSRENNEGSNTGEVRSSISHEEEED